MQKDTSVAIIGMGCIFPKSIGIKAFWNLLFNARDAITEIPEETHWSLKDYFHENPSTPDHTYCKKGGFIPTVSFDPARYGMPPNNLDATDTSQLLGLLVAEMALKDAGYPPGADFDRHRTNVILGVTGTQELVIPLGARLSHPIWRKALDDSGIPPEKTIEVLQRMSDAHTGWQENSFPGLLGNVVAGRIANRLDLGGTNTVVDAACASSLSAVQTACLELITGKCDMSVTGGVDTLNDIFMHMCFSKTGVLSHTSDARPFSKHADGTVLGEGIGMLVLKRLTDAEKDGNRIYAVIKSIGTSSDGKTGGIYAPDAQGQLRALKTAYSQADINPETVEMIEAHGTGTRVGDKIEFSALKQLMTENNRSNHCAVGSVKSMIGHAKAAAGAAGLIKAALSLHHKVIPPTLKAATPDPELNIDKTPFYLNDQSRPWLASHDHPRRSGVSAFGFGGSNFHAVLEEYQGQKNHVSWDGTVQIAAFSSDSIEKLKNQLVDFKVTFKDSDKLDATEKAELLAWHTSIQRKTFSSEAGFRLLFILHENDHIASKTDTALTLLDSPPDANQITPVKKSGIFFSARKDTGGIGFLFPGQGSQYTGMGRDIFSFFPEAIESLELAEKAFKNVWERSSYGIKNHIFPPPRYAMNKNKAEENLRNTDIAQPAIGSVSIAMCKVLKRFGVTPASTCGHSFGELPALYAAGWMDEETLFSLAVDRGKQMAARTDKKKDRGKMIAVKAPLEEIEAFIKKEKLDVVLANRNSHNQGILSGSSDEITKALKSCRANDLKAVELPVAAAFHSRLVEKAVRPFKKSVNGKTITPTDIPVLSNTTGTPYPDSSDKAKELLANQLINPVNFVKNIESMYQEGIHTFLEIGPKTVLTGLTRSILKGKPHAVLAMDGSSGRGSGIKDLANLLCQLSAMGINVALEKWEEQANQPEKKIMRVPLTGANIKPAAQCTLPPSPLMTTAPEKCEKSHASPLPMGDGHGARLKKQGINNRNERRAPSDFSSAPQSPITLKQNNQQLHIAKSHRSISKGADMASYNKQNKDIEHPVMGHSQQHSNRERGNHPCMPAGTPSSSLIRDAMQMVQQGLESMQALQASTARAHEKFLDTQAVASQSLQSMMEQTRFFAWNTISTVNGTHNREVDRPENSACTAAIQKYNRDTKPNNTSAAPTPARGNTNHTPLYSKETGVPPEIDYGTPQSITQSPLNDAQQHSQPHQKNQENGAPHQATGQFPDKRTATQTPAENTKDLLLATVSRLTGFPSEMLELNMDIESDLGIDSIKRVEILSELEKKLPQADALSPENMGTLRTLDDIYKALAPQQSSTETTGSFVMDSNQLEQEELNQSGFKTPDQTPDIDATTDTVEETGAFNFQNVMPILLNTISSLTGFPVEMLEPQMDLESDLGIDSIKRVEILSKLEQEIPKAASVSPDDMATLRTLEDIASHLAEKPTPSPENEKKKRFNAVQEQVVKKKVLRQVISLKKIPIEEIKYQNGSKITLPDNKTVYLTEDSAGIAKILQKFFQKEGILSSLIKIDDILGNHVDITDAAGLVIIADAPEQKNASSSRTFLKQSFLVAGKFAPILCGAAEAKGAFFSTISFMGGSFGFDENEIPEPVQGGLAGLSKTAALEWEGVACKSIDMPCTPEEIKPLAKAAVTLMISHGPVEAGLKPRHCIIPELIKKPLEPASNANAIIPGSNDVIVITGGAKGVTAQCAIAIAKAFAPTIILLGRSKAPDQEPKWMEGLTSDQEIKKAILKNHFNDKKPSPIELEKISKKFIGNREIKKNIEQMQSAGAKTRYIDCDIRDKVLVSKIFNKIKDTYGKITGIIHGAGVLEDRRIVDKNETQFEKVFNTKIIGLESLLQAIETDSLKYLILFSSVAARMGNTGQVDYAMANEVLNKTAQKFARDHGKCRVLSLNWGPWDGGMVNPSLKKEFERRGIDLIPLQEGADCLVEELRAGTDRDVEVILGAGISPKGKATPPPAPAPSDNKSHSSKKILHSDDSTCLKNKQNSEKLHTRSNHAKDTLLSTVLSKLVGIRSCPVLKDHVIAGEPILPFALMLEWFAHTAEWANPGLVFSGLDDMRLLKGVKPQNHEINLLLKTGKCTPNKNGFQCLIEMHTDDERVYSHLPDSAPPLPGDKKIFTAKDTCLHSNALIFLSNNLPEPPAHMPPAQTEMKPCRLSVEKAYEICLFHGSSLQGITDIHGISDLGIEVSAKMAPPPSEWLYSPHRTKWGVDPLVIDSAFQAAIIWCHETTGKVCLPTYIANFRMYSSFVNAGERVRINLTVNEKSPYSIKGYFTFLDPDQGKIIASITGFEAVTDQTLLSKFKPKSNPGTIHLPPNIQNKKPLFERDKILAFAVGKPSDAFGAAYEIFDSKREIARLPGPPYFFIDRIIKSEAEAWKMEPGGWIEAEFDMPSDGWYFTADKAEHLPFSILLEIALQPCGWLAAYAGSALKSQDRLYFRNLGGTAKMHKPVHKNMGTLTMRARMTNVSQAGGLIIQDFDMEVLNEGQCLYEGHTNFGFFTNSSLANQTGIKASPFTYALTPNERQHAPAFHFIDEPPFLPEEPEEINSNKYTSKINSSKEGYNNGESLNGMPSKALRMIDAIEIYLPEGGRYNMGYLKGIKKVDPEEWFFKAHFFQDPVCPGSLGIESFLQIIRFHALKKWLYDPELYDLTVGKKKHQWIYRGQIIPSNKKIEVDVHIKKMSEESNNGSIIADGILTVDGLCIYQMEDFMLNLTSLDKP